MRKYDAHVGPRRATLPCLFAATAVITTAVHAQDPALVRSNVGIADVRVLDARLDAALQRLVAGSESAAAVVRALASSGLPVTIGRPTDLASIPVSQGGPAIAEQRALLAGPERADLGDDPPVAWVIFRVAESREADGPGVVERAWLAVETDSIEHWIRDTGRPDAESLIEADYLAILAHEFVAHVGSIARTRRLDEFCDDPVPDARSRDAAELACSLRVENRVRRELNRGLALTGDRRLPERHSYALDVMNFAKAYARR